jgi:hypothetical protein
MNSWETARPFEVFDDVSVVSGIADLRNPEELDQFLFCHNRRVWSESAILAR